jgi:hypothetical protein
MSDTTTTTTVYKVTQQKLLIDLNGDLTNFDINFKARGESGKIFEALVVDQKTLDGPEPLVYKKVDQGQITANIISDNNIYQNFFLVLKSVEPCSVEVVLTKKSIPAAPQVIEKYDNSIKMNKSKFDWKIILIITILLAVGAYFLWKNYTTINTGITSLSTPIMDIPIPIPIPIDSEVSSPILPSFSKFGGVNSDLLSRLNSLSMK